MAYPAAGPLSYQYASFITAVIYLLGSMHHLSQVKFSALFTKFYSKCNLLCNVHPLCIATIVAQPEKSCTASTQRFSVSPRLKPFSVQVPMYAAMPLITPGDNLDVASAALQHSLAWIASVADCWYPLYHHVEWFEDNTEYYMLAIGSRAAVGSSPCGVPTGSRGPEAPHHCCGPGRFRVELAFRPGLPGGAVMALPD